MKVLFINTSDIIGGAAKVAFKLAEVLEKNYGIGSYFIVRTKKSKKNNVFQSRIGKLQHVVERIVNILMNWLGMQYFYLPFSPKYIIKKANEIRPDIISMHNIIGGYFQLQDLIKLSKIAPIVWTLHDMWAFTANAAHTFEDDSWLKGRSGRGERKLYPSIGLPTGNMLINRKKEIYKNSNMTIVAPSKWMLEKIKKSPLLVGKRLIHIPNGVDTSVFTPIYRKNMRDELNIRESDVVLLFFAEKVGNIYKGGGLLLEILRKLNDKLHDKVYLIILGKGSLKEIVRLEHFKLISPGYIHNEKKVADYIAASDILLYPTRADTFPGALLESLACQVPAVTFHVGGCMDIIEDNYNGYLIPAFDLDSFVQKTLYLISNGEQRIIFGNNGRSSIEKKFSLDRMSAEYYNLFKDVLNKKASRY